MGRLCGVIFLARDEFARLYTVANDTLKPILVLAVETGMRKKSCCRSAMSRSTCVGVKCTSK